MPKGNPAGRPQDADRTTPCVLGLLLISFIPYLNSLSEDFVYDDKLQIVGNPYVHSFHYLKNIFGSTVWTFQGAQGISNYYRPLMTLAYALCYQVGGLIPFGYHLLNVALHAAVVLLLFAVTDILFEDRLISLVSAALFALHPMHTESVTWVAGIPDTEMGVFFLLTFLLYLKIGRQPAGERRVWLLRTGMICSYVLALLSKEQAMVLPAVLTVYEFFYRADRRTTRSQEKAQRAAPLWIVAIGYICFRSLALGSFAPAMARPNLPWSIVLLTAVGMVSGYLSKLLWPTHFSIFYVFREVDRVTDPRFMWGLIGLLACLALFVWLWRRQHAMSFALVWMGATLGPVMNARWMPAAVFAERYLYMPLAGFCWLVAWAGVKIWRAASAAEKATPSPWHALLRAVIPAAFAALAIFYGVRTYERNADWKSEAYIYRLTLAGEPEAQLIRTNLGVLLWSAGEQAEAEREWLIAAAGPHAAYPATLNDLGIARVEQNRYEEAEAYFQSALRLNARNADPHKNLGGVYAGEGRLAEAQGQLHEAARLAPLNADLLNSYGHYLIGYGRLDEARAIFEQSAKADENSDAEESLGDIFLARNDLPSARTAYRRALKLYPFSNKAHFGLAAVEERDGHGADALEQVRAGLETDPANVFGLDAKKRLETTSDSR